MVEGRIRFSTDILSRLGEELNPNIDQGVIELVKNAYDADAVTCTVALEPDDGSGSTIIVSDDGDGMSVSDILSGWLVLGSSIKNTKRRTRLGRTPAGNKGLGRLAALRLGRHANLSTRPRGGSQEYEVSLDWDRYDQVEMVDDIGIPVVEKPRDEIQDGTQITIRRIRKHISRLEIRRLARAMILLADPFSGNVSGFNPILLAPAFEEYERLVEGRYFSDAEYFLTATLMEGHGAAEVRDWRGEILYKGNHDVIAAPRGGKLYKAPDAAFELWTYTLTNATFSTRATSLSEVRSWLDAFGGVHVYTNGLRVSPYGNAGSDWLEMNLSRVRSPEERPSTNNSIGRVSIVDPDGILEQKTDRSGFIESDEFEAIRRFAIDCLEWMARSRLATAETRRQRVRTETAMKSESSRASVQEQIKKVSGPARLELTSAFAQYNAERDREAEALRKEIQLYRTLSTAGITTATLAHESDGGPLKVIDQAIGAIERRARVHAPDQYEASFKEPIESIGRATKSLSVLSRATLRLVDQDKRRVGRVDLNTVVIQVLETFEPFLNGRDVVFSRKLSLGTPYLRGTEASVESIITNLLNNSLAAFENSAVRPRSLLIASVIIDNVWQLEFSDNGPGIQDIGLEEIWLPGQTRRPGGTGLGLTIVRDAVNDLGGSATAIANGELGGATFLIELPILGI